MLTGRTSSSDRRTPADTATPGARSADPGVGTGTFGTELVGAATAGDTDALERLRAHYTERLHERSDDFAATEALRSVNAALAAVPSRDDGIWAWQARERRREQKRSRPRARRWWRRRR
jgi:hypothetical protein